MISQPAKELMKSQRHFGLDVVRAFAIMCVIVSHGRLLLPQNEYNIFYTLGGLFGVELFFVLSGFLIGGILLKIEVKQGINIPSLLRFWPRRWWRTVPAYYFALLFVTIFESIFRSPDRIKLLSWKYFIFFQGFSDKPYSLLPVSWSLIIEEFFYLSLPVVALVLSLFFKRSVLMAAIVLFCGSLLAHYNQQLLPDWFSGGGFRSFPFRFTSISAGVLLVYLVNYSSLSESLKFTAEKIKTRWGVWCNGFLLLILAIVFLISFEINYEIDNGVRKYILKLNTVSLNIATIWSSLVVLSFYLLLPDAKNELLRKIITFISLISYSLYLLHMVPLQYLHQYYGRGVMLWGIYCLASLTIASLSYYFIECPYMLYRDKPATVKSVTEKSHGAGRLGSAETLVLTGCSEK